MKRPMSDQLACFEESPEAYLKPCQTSKLCAFVRKKLTAMLLVKKLHHGCLTGEADLGLLQHPRWSAL